MAEHGAARRELARVVGRGQALLAELLRLCQGLPRLLPGALQAAYAPVLFDFRYLKSPEHYEDMVTSSSELSILDDDFWDMHGPLLERFLALFAGLIKYHQDLLQLYTDLQDGVYVQTSVENLLAMEESRQLLAEALHLQGMQLLLLDHLLPGPLRERLLVCAYRHRGAAELSNFESLCLLCRSTGTTQNSQSSLLGGGPSSGNNLFSLLSLGFSSTPSSSSSSSSSSSGPRPYMLAAARAEEYLGRFPLPKHLVKLVLARLQTEDIYSAGQHYPESPHSSAALGPQAACVIVLLFYVPEILHNNSREMEEIVKRYFQGCWIVPLFVGFLLDLQLAWEGYRAAKAALGPTLTIQMVRNLSLQHATKLPELLDELEGLLAEGVLTADFVTRQIGPLLHTVRQSNALLRWALLHRSSSNRKVREVVNAALPGDSKDSVLQLLLKTAILEFNMRRRYEEVLNAKEEHWQKAKQKASSCMEELAAFFTGSQVLLSPKQ